MRAKTMHNKTKPIYIYIYIYIYLNKNQWFYKVLYRPGLELSNITVH